MFPPDSRFAAFAGDSRRTGAWRRTRWEGSAAPISSDIGASRPNGRLADGWRKIPSLGDGGIRAAYNDVGSRGRFAAGRIGTTWQSGISRRSGGRSFARGQSRFGDLAYGQISGVAAARSLQSFDRQSALGYRRKNFFQTGHAGRQSARKFGHRRRAGRKIALRLVAGGPPRRKRQLNSLGRNSARRGEFAGARSARESHSADREGIGFGPSCRAPGRASLLPSR